MSPTLVRLAAVAAVLAATPAFAQDPVTSQPAAPAAPASGPVAPPTTVGAGGVLTSDVERADEVVCRSVRKTGTKFPTRVCETRGQMAARREATMQSTDKIKQKSIQSIGRPALGL